ncbi:MAG TPA: hypothetical protein VN641_22875 [Urbifossiella sp.]|nr:hypothetical protein [Urbifossiella sp.]
MASGQKKPPVVIRKGTDSFAVSHDSTWGVNVGRSSWVPGGTGVLGCAELRTGKNACATKQEHYGPVCFSLATVPSYRPNNR